MRAAMFLQKLRQDKQRNTLMLKKHNIKIIFK